MEYEYINDCGVCTDLDCMSNAQLYRTRAECESLISDGDWDFAVANARLTMHDIDYELQYRAERQAAIAPISARLDASMHHYWHSIGLE